MRPGFFLKEAFRSLSRNAAPSSAAVLTVLITALTLGVFIPIVQATTGTANSIRDKVAAIVNRLAPVDPKTGKRKPQLAAIDEVRNRRDETSKILSATGLVKLLTAGLTALLVFTSIALVSNTIRLSIFSRRREVEVMKLVGATNWFIRWPFVIEGVVVGLMGGILAVLCLMIAKSTFVDPLQQRFALLAAPKTINFPLLIVVLLLACVSVSAIGSGLTLRRFLRV